MLKNKELISKMSIEEKASLLSGKDFWQTRDIKKYGIESLFCADGPHGIRKQKAEADHLGLNPSYEATSFPTAALMANTFDVSLIESVGIALGKEAKNKHVHVLLGPGTNIKRNPLCGRNFEYYSEDPYLSGKIASAQIRGIQTSGVSACVKHFAANNQEYRRLVTNSVIDERTLREIYLMPFEMAVKEGKTKAIMASYNKLNGIYANENNHLLNDVLRNTWGYKGIVISDWGGNNDRVLALKANAELEMPFTASETNYDVVRAIKSGEITEELLDTNIDRFITFNKDILSNKEKVNINLEDHHQLASKVAENGAVLLKNDNHTLPLSETNRVCIIGDFADKPRYQGAGSSTVNPTKLDKATEIIGSYTKNYIGFEPGFKRFGGKSNKRIKKAVKLAMKSDIILLFLGLDEYSEAEGIDRLHLKLPQNQIDLVNALKPLNKKIVIILSAGAVVELDVADEVDAVLHGYLAGQAGMTGLLNIIFGKVSPSGRLSETWPYNYEDTPTFNYFPGYKDVLYKESIFVGYRYFDTAKINVRYPFGYGLSYTTFIYRDLRISESGVSFSITNSGDYDSFEVAQLYIGKQSSEIFRTNKELKGFIKPFIKAKETVEVTIDFDDYSFRYFNHETKQFELEDGQYQIYIGASIEDIRLQGTIDKKGSNYKPYDKIELKDYYQANILDIKDDTFETLLAYKLPEKTAVEKKKIIVDKETTIFELKKAKGFSGRLFSRVIQFTIWFLKKIGKQSTANTLIMGVYHTPIRTLSRMSKGMINYPQLDGLILMFNGKFFKGIKVYFKEGRTKKKFLKLEKTRVLATEKEQL